MVIVPKYYKEKNREIKSYGNVPLTTAESKMADTLEMLINNLFEKVIKKYQQLNSKDPLDFWYLTGKETNLLLESKEFKKLGIQKYDLKNFWIGMDSIARIKFKFFKLKEENTRRDTLLRNIFYRAYRLSFQPYDKIKKLASWDTWREFLERPIFDRDPHFLTLLLESYYEKCHKQISREVARKLIKKINKEFKGFATEYMSEPKLKEKINKIIIDVNC